MPQTGRQNTKILKKWFPVIAQVSHYKPYYVLSGTTKNENENLSTFPLTTEATTEGIL